MSVEKTRNDAIKSYLSPGKSSHCYAICCQKDEVDFDDFMKMDIRTGVILEAEKVKKANKLLKLLVDTGLDQRTIVSGIAEHYSPEEIIGKKVSVLMNLAPRNIRGVESEGMILMAENEKGELSFVVPEKEFTAGAEVR